MKNLTKYQKTLIQLALVLGKNSIENNTEANEILTQYYKIPNISELIDEAIEILKELE